jgi:hypothetical protein
MRFRADQYRRKADRAREFAKQARDPFVKISYQEMARDWAVLAEQAEWFDSQQQPPIVGQRYAGRHKAALTAILDDAGARP